MIQQVKTLTGQFDVQISKSAKKYVPFYDTTKAVVKSFECVSRVNDIKRVEVILHSTTSSVFDAISRFASDTDDTTGRLWVRFGLTNGDWSKYTPWDCMVIESVRDIPDKIGTAGETIKITLNDLLYPISKVDKIIPRKGKISDQAQQIASDAGYEKFSIEKTRLDYSYIQSVEDDLTFLSRIGRRASNEKGEGSYVFFTYGGMFHFHTLGYQLDVFEVDYVLTQNSALSDLVRTNFSGDVRFSSAAGIRLLSFDPLTGKTNDWSTNPDSELSMANKKPDITGANLHVAHIGQNQIYSHQAESQWDYAVAKDSVFDAPVTITGFPYVYGGSSVKLKTQDSLSEEWSGIYFVKEVRHSAVDGVIKSRMFLSRGEYTSDPSNTNVSGKILSSGSLENSAMTSETSGTFSQGDSTSVQVNNPDQPITAAP